MRVNARLPLHRAGGQITHIFLNTRSLGGAWGRRVFAGYFSSCLIGKGGFNRLISAKATEELLRKCLHWRDGFSRLPDRDGGEKMPGAGELLWVRFICRFYVSFLYWLQIVPLPNMPLYFTCVKRNFYWPLQMESLLVEKTTVQRVFF